MSQNSTAEDQEQALRDLLAPLLEGLYAIRQIGPQLHPTRAAALGDALTPYRQTLERAREQFQAQAGSLVSAQLQQVAQLLLGASDITLQSMRRFDSAVAQADAEPSAVFGLGRALRHANGALESLYALAPLLHPVSAFFLEASLPGQEQLIDALRDGFVSAYEADSPCGIQHERNARGQRGGWSVYVPESYNDTRPAPLIVALHGGSGHGRDFLWNWLIHARSRNCVVLSPTSIDRTWSFIEPDDVDREPLLRAVEEIRARLNIDAGRILLTGMSDGATYSLYLGLAEDVPFTHLAPLCGVLHPMLVMGGGLNRARGVPIYLAHGTLDWMFPVHTAREAAALLEQAGAKLSYHEIEGQSHTYPLNENTAILQWLGAVHYGDSLAGSA